MASLGHVAIGVAMARVDTKTFSWRAAVAYSAASLAPDLDVLAFRFGLPYEHPFGHRGATHSPAFALLCGLVVWLAGAGRRSALLTALTVATHPLLDALTDGGLGVALLFPLSTERVFFPWQPLPVAPIGGGMLSLRGARVLFAEAAAFAPFLLFGLWPAKRSATKSAPV